MFNSLHSRVLSTVVAIMILTVSAIAIFVHKETNATLSEAEDTNARNILNAVMLGVENEYNSLVFHKKNALETRKNERKHIVSIVMAALEALNQRALSGELTQEAARDQAIKMVRKMRYDNGVGYLWINDTGRPIPRMIMHPTLPHLDGRILDDPRFNCALGKQQNLFQAFVDACLDKGEGYVDYLWPKPLAGGLTEDQAKISYVALFRPWDWVVGTGVYIDDIEADAEKRRQAILAELGQTFSRVRTTKSGYLFIFNGKEEMLIHPALTGKVGQELVNPASGKPIIEDLMAAARTPERVFEYIWDKPPDHKGAYRFRKRAYVRYFAPLDWYIGSSLYVDEIEVRFRALEKKIFFLALAGLVVAVLISTLVTRSLTTPLKNLMFRVRDMEESGITSAGKIPETGTLETRAFAHVLNRMVASVQQFIRDREALVSELKDARSLLELRVAERTRELETANRDLIAAKEKAEIANKAKSEFLANMSHEIRTPMNAVLGFAEILKEKVGDPELSHYIASIHSSGRSLLSLINDILDLSKVEAGKLTLDIGPLDIRALFREMAALFSRKAEEKGLELMIELDPGLPDAVLMDKVRLRQILVNLLGNAVKFTDRGHVLLGVGCQFPEASGQSLVELTFRVEDTGMGMTQAESEHIFDAFEQLAAVRSGEYGGTGLGLAITLRLTRIMKGEITVESAPGRGSCFELRFKEVEVAALHEETEPALSRDRENLHFDSAKLLIADDIAYNRELIRTYLDPFEFEFFEAENGKETLEKAKHHLPDLIFLDMKMPVMDGYTAAGHLKASNITRAIPVVAITASAMKADEDRIREICDLYLKKPVSRQEMIDALKSFLPHTVHRPEEGSTETAAFREPGAWLAEEFPETMAGLQPLAGRCRTLTRSMAIDGIEAFALAVKEEGEKTGCADLISWAEALHSASLRFDLDHIRQGLSRFAGLFDPKAPEGGE